MIYETIPLLAQTYGRQIPVLSLYIQDTVNVSERFMRPAVLICPGGGYEFTSDREGEPIALAFLNKGY